MEAVRRLAPRVGVREGLDSYGTRPPLCTQVVLRWRVGAVAGKSTIPQLLDP